MHNKKNLATMWLPWTPTREEPQPAEQPSGEQQWVQEEEKLKNAPATETQECTEDRLARMLLGMDIKRSVL